MIVRAMLFFLLIAFGPPLHAQAQEGPDRTARDGVYTAEQAERGMSAFRAFCGNCHTPGEFHGEPFQRRVGGDPVQWLFDYIRFNMPDDAPGSLTRRAYLSLMAYILELNGFPPGEEELGSGANALDEVRFPEIEPDSESDPVPVTEAGRR